MTRKKIDQPVTLGQLLELEVRINHLFNLLGCRLNTIEAMIEGGRAVDPTPPPDPVKESELYQQLVGLGVDEDVAYQQAEKKLNATATASHASSMRSASEPSAVAAASGGDSSGRGRGYDETPGGRLARIWDILHDKPPTRETQAKAMATWLRLEAAEAKHDVKGETSAFELLYPAMVQAARANKGRMTLLEFLDEKAIKQNRAPWDTGATGEDEASIIADTTRMLAVIERANHPLAQATAPTTEKVDGKTLTESPAQYRIRIKRIYQQLLDLQAKGV